MITRIATEFQNTEDMTTEIRDQLHKGIVEITFRKKDESIRVLRGTLKADLLPKVEPIDGVEVKPAKKLSDAVIVCFDTEKQEWRSFRKDSVIEFKYD